MEPFTAMAAGQPLTATAIGEAQAAAGTPGEPTGRLHRHGIAVAHTHLKAGLAGIDQGHPRPEMGSVGLPHLQHPVDPGVNHLVAEGAEGGRSGKGLQQGTGQEDLAAGLDLRAIPAPIEAGGAGEAAIAPAKGHQGPAIPGQGSLKVLTVELVKQGEKWFEGQRPATGHDPGRMAKPVCRDFPAARRLRADSGAV